MARRKAKTNVKKATTNVSATAVSTEMTNDNNSAIIKDDPGGGGTEDDIQKNYFPSKGLINRTNGLNVNFLKATKDQSLPLSVTSSPVSSNSSFFSSTAVSATSTVTTATSSTSNDSKYLHKKFKKFCATVDSNHSHNSDINKPATSTSAAGLLNNNNNNNSEIVEDRNSWTLSPQGASSIERNYQQLTVPSQTPKHLQTTEEEKQLVKDIIDINNENFMHHSANFTSSSFLIAQNSTSSANSGLACTVTTLGNHNSNFQLSDIRQKVESSTFNPASNSNFVIINNHQAEYSPASTTQQQQQQQPTSTPSTVPTSTASLSSSASSTPGRYICPYCQLNCAKPSVLQKHIRAHTNERPYPCTPCGFAFKTKSNLYKHCRSRAHIQRCSGNETDPSLLAPSNEEDGCSLESGDIDEIEVLSQNENMNHQRLSSPSIVMENQMNGNFGENSSSSSSNSSAAYPVNSSSDTSSIVTKPYKPKFHNYKKLDLSKANALQQCNVIAPISTPSTPLTPSFFNGKAGNLTPQIIEEHISRIISDNEAIIDNVEALLQKKYHKITGIQRNLTMPSNVSTYSSTTTTMTATTIVDQNSAQVPQSNSKLALALLKQQQQQKQHDEEIMRYQLATQPLNLIKMQEPLSVDVSTGVISVIPRKKFLNEIISAPLVITSSQVPAEVISIPLIHHHHQEKPSQLVIPNFGAIDGDPGDGTYSCPTCRISFRGADILKYHLICHCGDETINSRSAPISPTTQNNNATSPYYQRSSSEKHSPSSSLSNNAQSQLTPHMPSSLQKLAKSQLKVPKPKPENIVISPAISAIKIVGGHPVIVKNPLPSPGPLLGNTRLVDKRFEEEFNVKKQKLDYPLASPVSSSTISSSGSDKKNSPFFDVKFMHDRSTPSKNFPSGGSFTTLESNDMQMDEISPNNMMRHGLSGGILEVPAKRESAGHDLPPITPKLIVTITPTLAHTLTTNTNALFTSKNHFQFPPSVAVYNPLTLPLLSTHQSIGTQSIVHGGRVIPYVQGMPGPNTGMTIVNKNDLPPPPVPIKMDKRLNSPSMKQQNGLILSRDVSPSSTTMPRPNGVLAKKKSFNFARIADNIDAARSRKSPESNDTLEEDLKLAKPAFLRPTSLSLKPGTFTPKQHHGITPTANTLPLISPETPRPSKSCVQLYLNGHAYTYLGLKSSTKPFYCTVNKPQPSYIQNQHKLSMYSNWQIYNGNNPNIFDLSPYAAMSLYDSRQRTSKFSVAEESKELVNLVEMQTTKVTASIAPSNFQIQQVTIKDEQSPNSNNNTSGIATFENNSEDYTYIRGRGRGKYICQECGIRCKKPSMLKKHIRTHTDLRPYTCSYCEFSFKTKGNLTKHMKSKAHFKKCTELGISPIPTMPDDDINDPDDSNEKHHGGRSLNGSDDTQRDDSDTDDNDSDSGDDDTGDEDTDESKSRMPEHEAAQLLLSLSNHAGTRPSSENSTPHPPQMVQMSQQQHENNWQERVEPPLTPRSRIIFSKAKPGDFDFHDMGKYYSDPSLCRPKEYQQPAPREISVERVEEEEDSMPMDLTKKSHQVVQRPLIIAKFSDQSVLLNHLNSNTDNHHQLQGLGMNFTDAIQYNESYLPQEYHMERALNNARFKQIQHSGKIIDYERLQDKQKFSNDENATLLISKLPTQQQLLQQVTTTTSPIISTTSTVAASSSSSSNNNKNGMMDALAELAAKSDKLEIKNQGDESSKAINFNAKSVATEYLKLTQQKLLPRNAQEELGDCGSDQEAQEPAPAILTPQTIVVGGDGFHKKTPTSNAIFNNEPLLYSQLQDDSGRPMCVVCRKPFQRASQLKLHMNIHFMERKFRCEACSISFRTQGHLHKHERSASHENKVNMTSTFGVPTVSNPRPFKCKDCKIAFRIHGHLAKHLRSKMHVLKLECLQKLPFGTYAEMERAGFNLTDIDTSDCDNSLMSLRTLAKKLNEKDPSKLGPLPPLSNDDSGDCDESGMNENYDSDSSDQGHFGIVDEGNVQLKRKMDKNEFDSLKRIKLTENHANDTQVPSSNVSFSSINDGGEKVACAKN